MPWSTGCTRKATTEFGMGSWLFIKSQTAKKTRHIAVTGFSYLDRGNVMVPTAVESHIANATVALCGACLRAV